MLIILLSAVLTYFIYFFNNNNDINILYLNDNLTKEYYKNVSNYYKSRKILKKDYIYTYKHIDNLINDIEDNIFDINNKKYMKQLIHDSNIVILGVGLENITKLKITKDLDIPYFINNYDTLVRLIRQNTDGKILIMGVYKNEYLSKSDVIIINSNLSNIAIKYNAIFIDLSDLSIIDDNEITEMIIHSI